ncbi:hypothetical protein MINTM003_06500 [Mycobacterium paraintracellulare]|nr:hypothetical protein MINTM003_06500 [Mycobacterium paraintracellulare]
MSLKVALESHIAWVRLRTRIPAVSHGVDLALVEQQPVQRGDGHGGLRQRAGGVCGRGASVDDGGAADREGGHRRLHQDRDSPARHGLRAFPDVGRSVRPA